ncbi:MAG: hypothetical protein ACKVOR_08535 [Flavobacteriales bacterium]
MKNILIISILILILLSGCIELHQVIELDSKSLKSQDDYFIFENDSLKITYSFWAENGIMAFQIFNKTNRDIYLNWEKSSFIVNSHKFNYWEDKTKISSSGIYLSKNKTGYFNNFGMEFSSSIAVKEEQTSFIPPKCFIIRSTYILNPEVTFPLSDSTKKVYTKRDDSEPRSSSKNIYYYSEIFTEKDSPYQFRNYLTFSFHEDNSEKFSIDNEFYVHEITEFETRLDSLLFTKSNRSFYKIISAKNKFDRE